MKANNLKVVFNGRGINATFEMATDSRRPLDMVAQIQRVLNSNGFEYVTWVSISFTEDTLEVNHVVRDVNILGAYKS